jgi:hypothetical protein
VYYDFSGTSGNHAGMAHLVKLLRQHIPYIRLIKSVPHHYTGGKYIAQIFAVLLALYFKFVLKKEDKVFLFEYLTKGTAYQALTAQVMKAMGISQPIYALIHLSGQHLLESYNSVEVIQKGLNSVDKIFVFGSSLTRFLREIGFKKEIVTTFHYVDTNYYQPIANKGSQQSLQVICMGSLKRNFALLQQIVANSPGITFHILMGRNNLQPHFEKVNNVKLYPFLSEAEMLHLMQSCDVGMSVLEDTIGSNVITTSMAVGLVQVVSDVGSIRDYCDESHSFLCSTEQDFLNALVRLDRDRDMLYQLRQITLQKAAALSHKVFINQFKEFV